MDLYFKNTDCLETQKMRNALLDSHFKTLMAKSHLCADDERFTNRYIAETMISVIEGDNDAYKSSILAMISRLKNCPKTMPAQLCLYQVFLVAMAKKDIIDDDEVIVAMTDATNGWPDFSSTFACELVLLKG